MSCEKWEKVVKDKDPGLAPARRVPGTYRRGEGVSFLRSLEHNSLICFQFQCWLGQIRGCISRAPGHTKHSQVIDASPSYHLVRLYAADITLLVSFCMLVISTAVTLEDTYIAWVKEPKHT
jgi:hypothetical protein